MQSNRVYKSTQLNDMIRSVTCWANSLMLPAGSKIALVGKNSVYYITAILGLRESQYVSVPINYKLSKTQIKHCVQECAMILCDKEFLDALPSGVVVQDLRQQFCGPDLTQELDAGRLSMILYTSGSTGNPKAVRFSYQDLIMQTYTASDSQVDTKFIRNVRMLGCNPFFHFAGINTISKTVYANYDLFVIPDFDPYSVFEIISRYKINTLHLIKPMLLRLLDTKNNNLELKSVSTLWIPSTNMTVQDCEQVKNIFPEIKNIWNFYGLTETGSAIFEHDVVPPTPYGSVGRAKNFTVAIINDTLHVKTSEIKSDYKNINQEWFDTGDRFRVDEHGFYYYLGRADDMFKVNGEKVYPHEIETILAGHPCVDQVCVTSVQDDICGAVPVAFVSLRKEIDPEHLIAHARQRLAKYQIPRRIGVVEQFPTTRSGKIDRLQLFVK